MGLLDPKSRIVDAILTDEGKRQLAAGGLDVAYYVFDDAASQYRVIGGVYSPAEAATLEASQRAGDVIFARSDETGAVYAASSGSITFTNNVATDAVTGESAAIDDIIVAADPTQSLSAMSILHSVDAFDDNKLEIGPQSAEFVVTDTAPVSKRSHVIEIDHADPLFADLRLSHVTNFLFLPPVTADGPAAYDRFGAPRAVSAQEHIDSLSAAQHVIFMMQPRPVKNDIALQMLCVRAGEITKLHAVECDSPQSSEKLVFFGKLCRASDGHLSFVRLFSLVISR